MSCPWSGCLISTLGADKAKLLLSLHKKIKEQRNFKFHIKAAETKGCGCVVQRTDWKQVETNTGICHFNACQLHSLFLQCSPSLGSQFVLWHISLYWRSPLGHLKLYASLTKYSEEESKYETLLSFIKIYVWWAQAVTHKDVNNLHCYHIWNLLYYEP